jgi:DUF1680 family protein
MIRPLPRQNVRLNAGPIRALQDRNGAYLLSLPADRLLHNFRVNAGLASSAEPLGGWENPECGLRGHFTGHYLSACAASYAATGDERFALRLDELLSGLRECQTALGGGYLSAFPQTDFDTLETRFGGVWAPYYTLHKILAGLIDAHKGAGRALALPMASDLGDWIVRRLQALSPETLEPMLKASDLNPSNEYGGIGVALYDLYALTRKPEHLEAAKTFDRDWFLAPLAAGDDSHLDGLHTNTHLPQGLAAARRHETTGEEKYRRAVEFLWQQTALHRSYVSGGSSGPRPDHRERSEGGEHWPAADRMAKTLTPKISESCVTHNMLRLTDAVAAWSDDPRYADFRERAWLNSVLPTQKPGQPGGYLYSHPLGAGSRKVYGDAEGTFWCCYGTGVEAFARLADGIYAEDGDTLYVRQFVASEAEWASRGIRVVQQTGFPYEQVTRLTLHTDRPTTFILSLRVPGWAAGATCTINGAPITVEAGKPVVLKRTWADGDRVELHLPMTMRCEMLPGDPTHHAFVYGPVVLAARTPHAPELGVVGSVAAGVVRVVDAAKLHFEAPLVSGHVVPLVPLAEIIDEAYGVYFKTPG